MRRREFIAIAGASAFGGCQARFGPTSIDLEFQNLNVSMEKIFPEHRYNFYLTGTDEDPESTGRSPISYADLDPEARRIIWQIREPEPAGFDDPPKAILKIADEHLIRCGDWCPVSAEFVMVEYIEPDLSAPPLGEFGATVTEKETAIDVTLTNKDDEPFEVFSGAGPPFGALKAVGIEGTDHVIELWSPSFSDSDVTIRDGRLHYPDVGVMTEFVPGASITRTYQLSRRLTDEFVKGTYVLSPRSDASSFVFGEKTEIPFPVEHYNPDNHRLKEIVDFRVTVDLV